jgi:hypothetical protein
LTRRRGVRRKKLLDDRKDRRGYSNLKGEARDRTMWRNRFGRDVGPVVRQITEKKILICCKDITILSRRTLWTRNLVFYCLEKKVFCFSTFLAYFSLGFYL